MTLIELEAGWLSVADTGGDGVPVVLLHPGITDSSVWDRVAPLLGETRRVRYDRPGYGHSPPAKTATRPVDDLLGVLDALEIERAHLVGNSMGGGTALALAVTEPGRVASVTALCSAAGGFPWPAEAEDAEVDARFEALSRAGDVDGLAELYLQIFAAAGVDDYLRAQVRATTELELSGADLAERDPAVWADLPGLACPVGLVAGERDEKASIIGAVGLAEQIPGAELLRLDTDHLPQYRDPEAVAELVRRTLARA